MHRQERYEQGTGVLIEAVEIERQSPSVVRYRRYGSQGILVEDRPATASEQASVDAVDAQEAREQARPDFVNAVNALPAANPQKAILLNLIKALRWDKKGA